MSELLNHRITSCRLRSFAVVTSAMPSVLIIALVYNFPANKDVTEKATCLPNAVSTVTETIRMYWGEYDHKRNFRLEKIPN